MNLQSLVGFRGVIMILAALGCTTYLVSRGSVATEAYMAVIVLIGNYLGRSASPGPEEKVPPANGKAGPTT